jgi:hypothetical protein
MRLREQAFQRASRSNGDFDAAHADRDQRAKLQKFRRMVPAVACASSVPSKAIRRKAVTST